MAGFYTWVIISPPHPSNQVISLLFARSRNLWVLYLPTESKFDVGVIWKADVEVSWRRL